ncbi:MAG: helix-turn-helix domain-containing protein [Thiogranum sp.]|nr:helix-turn-helix domain-containing protein [Thiogranum sp.]
MAANPSGFRAVNNVWIEPDCSFADCGHVDVVCVPEMFVAPGARLDDVYAAEICWLRECYASGAILATACSGALLAAAAGMLDGHDATTHWGYCESLAHDHPRVQVHASRALVASGVGQRIIMAGGGTTWQDLALYLVTRLLGVEEAMELAKIYLIDWHSGGQQPFASLARAHQVADSRFAQATGMTPMEYVHTLRLEEAKQMLESGDLPVEAIAGEVGYEDAAFFSRLFRRKVELTPAQYRKRFGGLRKALQSGSF